MATTITMPQLGETVTEGTILSWAKQPGDTIAEDEVLLEISTDKVDTEIPSPAAGVVLEILVPEGETVEVGTPLVIIGEAGESTATVADAAPAAVPETPPPPPPPPPVVETVGAAAAAAAATQVGAVPANLSPVVRKIASEHGVDLAQVTGTGRGGRITRKDVVAYVEGATAPAPTAAPSAVPTPAASELAPEPQEAPAEGLVEETPLVAEAETLPAPTPSAAGEPISEPAGSVSGTPPPTALPEPPADVAEPVGVAEETADIAEEPVGTAEEPAVAAPAPGADEIVPLDRLRTRIAQNMIKAKQTAAHVWTSIEVDFESVERVRQAHRANWKAQEGFSLTYLPFIARATIDALAAYPKVNSSFFLEEGHQVFHRQVNLGIAIDLNQEGLIVTPVKGADGLRLRGIAREISRLAAKARGGDLEPDDVAGGTFTITNPGPFGSFMSAPIIGVPNVAILSTDTVVKRPTVITNADGSDAIGIHHIGYLGLTWDHRAFDGSTAVLFLARIKENLQNWDWEQELQ
ncbi:MAG: 2-oxo acid dehydrogenase subunit E2 [Acidimicrobiia bacterium]|nr:2-oxo acid dehydrogenase subunit E2 [Acidimicrobiia bacterium]